MRRSIPVVMFVTAALAIACGGGGANANAQDAKSPASTTTATAASADGSLEERETWTAYQADAERWAKDVSNQCGAAITGAWNQESFRPHLAEVTKDPWTRKRCEAAFDAVIDICRQGDLQKDAVKKKVASIECAWGPDGKGGAAVQGKKVQVTVETGKDATTPSYLEMIKKGL